MMKFQLAKSPQAEEGFVHDAGKTLASRAGGLSLRTHIVLNRNILVKNKLKVTTGMLWTWAKEHAEC